MYRGSRKHILDWVESPGFLAELTDLVKPVDLVIPTPAAYAPRGYGAPKEAQLSQVRSEFAVLNPVRNELRDWWLKHPRGARTPNWDLVVACQIDGRSGLLLVEAKANHAELKVDGISKIVKGSSNSRQNHRQIRLAIASARKGLAARGIETRITAFNHYQLANRVAFMWKLATLGIPTVLVYLGFTGDSGIDDVGPRIIDEADWRAAFNAHAKDIIPTSMLEKKLDLGGAPAWLLIRSRPVKTPSKPARKGQS